MFGSSTWLTINAIWVELSLYTSKLPESWSLPSYLAAIIQIACVGPLLYSVLHKCVRLHIEKPPLILAMLLLSTVSMLALAFFWEYTVFIFGAQRSVPIFLLTFFMALVSSTSNVLFLPFMATFHPNYLTAYFVGMSFSSLVPSVVKLIQGVGNYECIPSPAVHSPNGTWPSSSPRPAFVAVQTEPLFHIRLYNLAMFAWMCAATASFGILYWNGRKKGAALSSGATSKKTKTKMTTTKASKEGQKQKTGYNNDDDGDESDGGDGRRDSSAATARGRPRALHSSRSGSPDGEEEEGEQSPLKSSKTAGSKCCDTGGDTQREPTRTASATAGAGGEKGNDKMRYWTLIVCLALICAEMNTIIPSIQSYATLAYSLLTYHLALTLSNLSHPLANFLPLWVKPRSLSTVLALVTLCTVCTLFIFMLALQSPEPIFRDSAPHLGSALAITLSVLTGFGTSYLRTHITGLIRGEHPDSESLLFWCGFFMQVGSFVGACVMFPLVNIFKIFQKRDQCT